MQHKLIVQLRINDVYGKTIVKALGYTEVYTGNILMEVQNSINIYLDPSKENQLNMNGVALVI